MYSYIFNRSSWAHGRCPGAAGARSFTRFKESVHSIYQSVQSFACVEVEVEVVVPLAGTVARIAEAEELAPIWEVLTSCL